MTETLVLRAIAASKTAYRAFLRYNAAAGQTGRSEFARSALKARTAAVVQYDRVLTDR